MHPEIVCKKTSERGLLISCVAEARFIGEVGLDGSMQHQDTRTFRSRSSRMSFSNVSGVVGGSLAFIPATPLVAFLILLSNTVGQACPFCIGFQARLKRHAVLLRWGTDSVLGRQWFVVQGAAESWVNCPRTESCRKQMDHSQRMVLHPICHGRPSQSLAPLQPFGMRPRKPSGSSLNVISQHY